MIVVNGNEYRTLKDPIEANGRRVIRVEVDGTQVYPDEDGKIPLEAMWFQLKDHFVSPYSDTPVDRYGTYIKASSRAPAIHRVAFVVTDLDKRYPMRQAFMSYKGFVLVAMSLSALFVPFVAYGDDIVVDGTTSSIINVFMVNNSGRVNERRYYYSDDIGANLADKDGHYLAEYTVETRSSDNCIVVSDKDAAIAFVTAD